MKRLKITAELKSNPIINSDLYLDGILYAMARKKQMGSDYYNLPRFGKQNIEKIVLPLVRKNKVYLASKACYKVKKEYINRWRKRWNELSAGRWCENKRVYINQKITKNYDMPVNVTIVKNNKVWWYCIGDKNVIQELLNMSYYIGKEGNQGYGQVKKWIIEESDHKGVRSFPVIDEKNLPKNEIVKYGCCYPPYSRVDKKLKYVIRSF